MTHVESAQNATDIGDTARLVGFLGEPFVGLMTRSEAAQLLLSSGHTVDDDSGITEWRRRYTDNSPRPASKYRERIVMAERSPSGVALL